MLSEAASSNREEMSARENKKILLESLEIKAKRPFKRSQMPQRPNGDSKSKVEEEKEKRESR